MKSWWKSRETAAFPCSKHQGLEKYKVRGLSGMKQNLVCFRILQGIRWGLMNGASILKLFKLFIILTLVLKQQNNAKIDGFLKLLMWGGCIQISLTLSKCLTWKQVSYVQLLLDLIFFLSYQPFQLSIILISLPLMISGLSQYSDSTVLSYETELPRLSTCPTWNALTQ